MLCYLYSLFFYKELAKLKCTQNLKENNSIKRKTGGNISICRVYARKYMADYNRLCLAEIEPGGPRGYVPVKRGFLRFLFFFFFHHVYIKFKCVCNPTNLTGS